MHNGPLALIAALFAACLAPVTALAIENYSHGAGSNCTGSSQDPVGAVFEDFSSDSTARSTIFNLTGWTYGGDGGSLLLRMNTTSCSSQDPSAVGPNLNSNPAHRYHMRLWHDSTRTAGTPFKEHEGSGSCTGKWIVDTPSGSNGYTAGRQALETAFTNYPRQEVDWGNTAAMQQCSGPDVHGDGMVAFIHDQEAYGFNDNWPSLTPQADYVGRAARAGATTARFNIDWRTIVNMHNDWTIYTNEYNAMLSAGIHPILIAIAAGPTADRDPGCLGSNSRPPLVADNSTALTDWQNFVKQIAANYPLAKGIEIWNEPNSSGFWGDCNPNPDRYVRLLKYAVAGVESSGNPNVPVILGSPAPHPDSPPTHVHIAWDDWLNAVFTSASNQFGASWMANHLDVIGLHPYANSTNVGDGFGAAASEEYTSAVNSHDPIGVPVWVTETGTTTTVDSSQASDPPPTYVGPVGGADPLTLEPLQASADADIERQLRNDGARVVIIHSFQDNFDPNAAVAEHGYGVLDAQSGVRCKQAYFALAAVRGLSPTCP